MTQTQKTPQAKDFGFGEAYYVYADYGSGRIWGLTHNAGTIVAIEAR